MDACLACKISPAVYSLTEIESPNEFYPVPPPYSVATSLPTYDEAEKAKAAAIAAAAAEAAAQRVSNQFGQYENMLACIVYPLVPLTLCICCYEMVLIQNENNYLGAKHFKGSVFDFVIMVYH